jgi:hypothetical protein
MNSSNKMTVINKQTILARLPNLFQKLQQVVNQQFGSVSNRCGNKKC